MFGAGISPDTVNPGWAAGINPDTLGVVILIKCLPCFALISLCPSLSFLAVQPIATFTEQIPTVASITLSNFHPVLATVTRSPVQSTVSTIPALTVEECDCE